MEGLVESSSNLGVVNTEGNIITLSLMPRSSVENKLDEIIMKLDMIAKLSGAKIKHYDRHPGWEYRKDSKMRKLFSDCYSRKFNKKPTFEAIHAGVECGIIISGTGRDMDGISTCANVEEIHTPNERLNLKSAADAYEIILDMLKTM